MPLYPTREVHPSKLPSPSRRTSISSSINLGSTFPAMTPTRKYEFEFWSCGHITRISDGATLAENGELAMLSPDIVPRNKILQKFGDACPRCYTGRVLYQLQNIKLLLFDLNTGHEAVKIAESKVVALTEYLLRHPGPRYLAEEGSLVNYPAEFETMMFHVMELGIKVHRSASEAFQAEHSRLRSRETHKLVNRINGIRDNAQVFFTMGTSVVRDCMALVVNAAANLVREIEKYEQEEQLMLYELDAKAVALKILLDEFAVSERKHAERLSRPEF